MTRPIYHVTFHVLTVDVTQMTLFYYPRRCKNPKDRIAISFTVTTQMYPCPLLYVVILYRLYSTTLQRSTQKQIRKKRKVSFGFAYCGDKVQCMYTITIFKLQKNKSVLHNWTKVSQGLPPAALHTTHNCLIQIAWLAGINEEGAPHSSWCHVSVGW